MDGLAEATGHAGRGILLKTTAPVCCFLQLVFPCLRLILFREHGGVSGYGTRFPRVQRAWFANIRFSGNGLTFIAM
jgi:hypothetical protein